MTGRPSLPKVPRAAPQALQVADRWHLSRWILTHPDALPEGPAAAQAVLANWPELTALAVHVRFFGHMVAHLQGDQLPSRIEAAASTTELPPPDLRPTPRTRSRRRHRRPHSALELRRRGGSCQPDQDAQAPDVRSRRIRSPAQTRPVGVTESHATTRSGPEPELRRHLAVSGPTAHAAHPVGGEWYPAAPAASPER